jgi:hypothetical protein
MALIANVSFSKKIPVEGEQYSSQGYSLSLQTEITESEPAAIHAKLHQTFELVKSQVEHELANGNGRRPGPADPGSNTVEMPAPRNSGKASTKQIKYLVDILSQRGIAVSEFNADIAQRFGVGGVYELSKAQASKCIDELSGKRKAA